MQRRYYGFIVGLVLILVAGCGPSPFTTGATPEDAAAQHVFRQTPPGETYGFTALYTYEFEDFAVVFHDKPHTDAAQTVYYEIVHRNQTGWYTKECCDGGGGSLLKMTGLGDFVRVTTSKSLEPMFVYGRTLSPDVATVEVEFDTGETISDQPTDGFFFVLSDKGRNVCTIQLHSAQYTLLAETPMSRGDSCTQANSEKD